MKRARLRMLQASVVVTLAIALGAGLFIATPLPEGLLGFGPDSSVHIRDRHGLLLREVRSATHHRSTPITAADVSATVRAAFFAAEDKGFESHLGISPSSIVRAAWVNFRAGRVVNGGSTITQQLARTLVPRERTLFGKVQEALWALRLEAHCSKDEILTQYLNRIPFGNETIGIEAASQLYFGKPAVNLSLAQAALLAAIPRSPTLYNPLRFPQRAEARRQWVLDRIADDGVLDTSSVQAARSEPLDFSDARAAFRAPHFVNYVLSQIKALGLEDAASIVTTLDLDLQYDAEAQLAREVGKLRGRHVSNAAALIVDNHSGEILTYAGSADFFREDVGGQNDGVQMLRQPGSTLKPFLYAQAFEQRGFTPATIIPDLDIGFRGPGGSYSPKNYDRRTHGPVRAREALASSYNVPAVRVANEVGTDRMLSLLRSAGFESLTENAEHYGLGLALGNGEVRMMELARAYSGLSRGGINKPLRFIVRALRADGSEIPLPSADIDRRFIDASSVALVTHILSDNAARARAFGIDNVLRFPFAAAAKTGTSKGYSDNWTAGFTKERTVVVWAGNFDGSPMQHISGITGAGPIFHRLMERSMEGRFPQPLVDASRFEEVEICPLSGERAGPNCPAHMPEWFRPGTEPTHDCSMHRSVTSRLPKALEEKCLALAKEEGRIVDLGLDFYDWARNEGFSKEPWLASLCHSGTGVEASAPLSVIHPVMDDEFLILSDLPRADQAVPLRVRADPKLGALHVLLDGQETLVLRPPFTGRLPVSAGLHQLQVRSEDGHVSEVVRYRVREERMIR